MITQRDLLDERVWRSLKAAGRGLKGAARAGVGLAADTLDVVAPEITKPLHSIEGKSREIGRNFKQSFLRNWKGRDLFIADKLLHASFLMDVSKKPKKLPGKELLVYAHKIVDYDEKGKPVLDRYKDNSLKKAVPLIVDSETGQISKNINQARVLNKPKN